MRLRRGATGHRVLIGSLLGGVAGAVVAFVLPWQATVLVGWDVACLYFLVLTWSAVGPKSAGTPKPTQCQRTPAHPWRIL